MFCPKCGTQNPETGKFCRSCGTDLGNVSEALTGNLKQPAALCDRKGRPISFEGAIVKFFTGVAFLAVRVLAADFVFDFVFAEAFFGEAVFFFFITI